MNSLFSSYLDFLGHYRMNKPAVNYHGLMGLLQTYEKDHQLNKGVVNLVGDSENRHCPFGKGKKKKEGKRVQGAPWPSQAKEVRAGQVGVECFYYKKQGHQKRNCPLSHASLDANRPRKENQQGAGQDIYMIDP